MTLKGKPGIDLAFPVIKLWVDKDTKNVLKRQEFALSGRLLRTSYYPKWKKAYSESKKGDTWFPEEIRFFDEVEKANSTLILIKSVDFHAAAGQPVHEGLAREQEPVSGRGRAERLPHSAAWVGAWVGALLASAVVGVALGGGGVARAAADRPSEDDMFGGGPAGGAGGAAGGAAPAASRWRRGDGGRQHRRRKAA